MAEALVERAVSGEPKSDGGWRLEEARDRTILQVIARAGREQDCLKATGLPLPERPSTALLAGDTTLFCLRPSDWWLVRADPAGRGGGAAVALRERLQGVAAVIDQSHGRVVLRLCGPDARGILQKRIDVDLHPSVFGAGAMAQTAIAGMAVLLHGVEQELFDLYVPRSFTADVAHWISAR